MQKTVSVTTLREAKVQGEKIAVITAYDASFAAVVDRAGVDVILVGDSLGMVIQGRDSTIPVRLEHIVYHSRCVTRNTKRPLVVADMPFLSYSDVAKAIDCAAQLMQVGGAQMVKLEGGDEQAEVVYQLSCRGIPVCAHLGLQPQYVHKFGGYRVQGVDEESANKMKSAANTLVEAGADMMVLECVPQKLASDITAALSIPVIGIGAGADTDGQVLVLYDVLGISPRIPKFAKDFASSTPGIEAAVAAFVVEVKSGAFPCQEHVLR